MCGSTCFGRLSAHHQERTTALEASDFTIGAWRLERCWSWSARWWAERRPKHGEVFVWLNMFRAPLRPSSGAYNCTRSLWFYRWSVAVGALLVVVSQTTTNKAPTVKPELLVQFYAPDDGRRGARNMLSHTKTSSNKLVKLLHLVGWFIWIVWWCTYLQTSNLPFTFSFIQKIMNKIQNLAIYVSTCISYCKFAKDTCY